MWRDSWDGFIVFIFICIVSYGALQSSQKYHLEKKKKKRRSDSDSSRRPTNQHQAGEEEEAEPRQTRSNCPGHNFRTLYVSIYNIFPYFLYILNICLTVFTFCSTNRGLLWLCGLGRGWGGAGKGGGGSIYILERCLHISKSYVSCLGKSMTLYFIYLLKYLGLTRVSTFSLRGKNNNDNKKVVLQRSIQRYFSTLPSMHFAVQFCS